MSGRGEIIESEIMRQSDAIEDQYERENNPDFVEPKMNWIRNAAIWCLQLCLHLVFRAGRN